MGGDLLHIERDEGDPTVETDCAPDDASCQIVEKSMDDSFETDLSAFEEDDEEKDKLKQNKRVGYRETLRHKFQGEYCDRTKIASPAPELQRQCKKGGDYLACVRSLTAMSWLIQRWEVEKSIAQGGATLSPQDYAAQRVKFAILERLLLEYGFDTLKHEAPCIKESETRQQETECLHQRTIPMFFNETVHRKAATQLQINQALDLLQEEYPQTQDNGDFTVGVKNFRGEHYPVLMSPDHSTYYVSGGTKHDAAGYTRRGLVAWSDEDPDREPVLREALGAWVTKVLDLTDKTSTLSKGTKAFRARCGWVELKAKEDLKKYTDAIAGVGYNLVYSAQKECAQISKSVETVMMRIQTEASVGCDKKKQCTPDPEVCGCPEGFACDMRRLPRKGAMILVGSAVGGAIGAGLGTAIPVLGSALFGLITAGPAGAAAGAVAGLMLPGKIQGAVIGSAMGGMEVLPTCSCFPLVCAFDKLSDSCVIKPTHFQNNSERVGYPLLPLNGMKCIVSRKSTFRKRSICSLQACQDADAMVPGPYLPSGQRLFGRVGTRDKTVFNCANTNGNVDTLIMLSEKLPDHTVRGVEVNNTVQARKDMLRFFPNVDYEEVGWQKKKNQKGTIEEEDEDDYYGTEKYDDELDDDELEDNR